MSTSDLVRWSGLAAIVGGVLAVLSDLVSFLVPDYENFSETATTGAYTVESVLFLLATVLLLLGLVGLYASQAEAAGVLGLVAFLVAFLGTALVVGAIWAETFVAPSVAEVAPEFLDEEPGGRLGLGFLLSFPLSALGWLLFGVATYRARVYPRWAAILLMVGAALSFLPLPILGVAIGVLGFFLFTGYTASTEQSSTRVR